MTVVISDLVARVRAEGVAQATQDVKAYGDAASQTARALEIMAQAAAKQGGGTQQGWMEIFQKTNVQPTADAMAQAAEQMQKTAAATNQAAAGAERFSASLRSAAQAAADVGRINISAPMASMLDARGRSMANAMVQQEGDAQRALQRQRDFQQRQFDFLRQQRFGMISGPGSPGGPSQNAQDSLGLSESSLVRFGAGLVGVSLGISLVAGAARLVHDTVEGIVTSQLDWERSLKSLSGLYGTVGVQAAAVANAQANLPGVLGTQQEFAQAALNASALHLRYGVGQQTVDQLITTGGRIAYATGMTDPAQRAQLQQQILAAVQTGAALPAQYGIFTDAEMVGRRLGGGGAQALQVFTPQEVMQARAAIVTEGGAQFADRAGANQRAALDAVTAAQKMQEQAATQLQQGIEGLGAQSYGVAGRSELAQATNFPLLGPAGERQQARDIARLQQQSQSGNIDGLAAIDAEKRAMQAADQYAKALADSAKVQEDSRQTFERLSKTADAAGAQLIRFFGSLEDQTSIAHGDILAQTQAAVLARSRSAIPLIGQSSAEITAIAAGTAAQQAWQNFVAPLAQQEQTNAIRGNLEQQAGTGYPVGAQGPGLDPRRRTAAQQALNQMPGVEAVQIRIGTAQRAAAIVDMQTAQTQANLEQIQLTQRERYVQLLRDTVDLRRLDVQQQMQGVEANQMVIRAQQAALPGQYALSDAQYQVNRTAVLAQARLARVLQGKDVSGFPSIEALIQENVRGQFAVAEAGPAALEGGRGVEVAQRTATARGLAQQATANQLQLGQLGVDLKNLGDLPTQTALELELVQNNRDQLSVQQELREYMKQLVYIMTPGSGGGGGIDLGALIFGEGGNAPAPSSLPGARRGPF